MNLPFRVVRSLGCIMAAALVAVAFGACGNPLDIQTDRRTTLVNIDSVITTEPFIRAPGDSIFARVQNVDVAFATEVARPIFHNGQLDNGYYVTVQATRYGLIGRDYELISLRLDAVRDTGTYQINSSYSAPKQIDSLAPPRYGASYERRTGGGFPESYRTGEPRSSGSIRVVRIDEERGVMVGTFSFVGYSVERDTILTVDRGAFRLQLHQK